MAGDADLGCSESSDVRGTLWAACYADREQLLVGVAERIEQRFWHLFHFDGEHP